MEAVAVKPKEPLPSRAWKRFKREKVLWLVAGAALIWLFIFAFIPMFGIVMAFYNFIPGRAWSDLEFVGLRFFIQFINLPDFGRIVRNTLVISGLNMTIGFAAPIIFALLLNELFNKPFKRIVQTISYMPHFVSWVVVASIMTTLLGGTGLINEVLLRWGWIENAIPFLNSRELFWPIMITANVWKGVGWSAIIYLGAIAGVDQELHQAGAVDGLGRFGRVWHITLPAILPTIILLFILGIGNILNTGFEYQLLLGTPLTREVHEVVDTFVFRYGVQLGRFSFAAAAGLLRSIIGFTLVITTNMISKKVTDISIM
ncbi:MAG: ABC transporter permease subunit [Defluviitaleaceae bacterium]|nr:ABC transporter permease subunit [Defluviitaleaceae bacterium]